jgi:nanoRNase/pAp phosphatase (c-di-AMP/oligoRNAs hydrolase)
LADNRFNNNDFEDVFSNSSKSDEIEDIFSNSANKDSYEDISSFSGNSTRKQDNENGEYYDGDFTVKYNSAVQNRRRQEIQYDDISDVYGDIVIIDEHAAAAAELVADMLISFKKTISKQCAYYLYSAIVGDSGRFQYGSNLAPLFRTSAYLVENGADPQFIYRNLYVESLESRIMKNYFQTKMQLTKNNVAYMFNDKDVFEKFDVDTFTVSRGMVNLMAGIDKVKIWANFTYDRATGKVFGEFRSRDIVIVDIAKQFGGGGHANACGATLDDFEVAKEVLECFDKLLEEIENV